MRQALRERATRAQVSQVVSIPSPVGGWNARDPEASMPPTDARKLLNWVPGTMDCRVRGGWANHGTVTGLVETLAVYNKANGTSVMFAATDTDVYNVSAAGAGVAQTVTITDGKCQYLNFGDGTTNWLIMVNGVNKPLYFNGTSWISVDAVSTPLALTGLTTTSIIHLCEHKGRLYFIEKNSLSFWYLAAGAAGGALTEFQLDSFCNRGGYLMWMATWSFDSGSGPDDAAVFMTSEGEVLVYQGINPSVAANWVLVGVYYLGKPVGRRSFVKFAGDLIAITQNGAFPLSSALQAAEVDARVALTNKIDTAFTSAAKMYRNNFGWEAIVYPAESAILFNIPKSPGQLHSQYVMNTITKAWCEFDAWNAECFAEYEEELYYGANGVVRKAWTGLSDNGTDIVAIGKTAFSGFGAGSQQKQFKMFRPLIKTTGSLTFRTGMDVDFSDNDITGTSTYNAPAGAIWGAIFWGSWIWGGQEKIVRIWSSPQNNVGYYASAGIKVNTNTLDVHWMSSDFLYESGGVL